MARHQGLYRRRQYWYFKAKDEFGKWIEIATRTSVLQEAITIRTAYFREKETGQLPNNRSLATLEAASEAWHADRKLRVAKGTCLSEAAIIRNLKRVLGANTRLAQLADILVIKRYESVRLREGRHHKTVNNEILVLTGILRDANLWHRIESQYKPLRVPKSDVGEPLTQAQEKSLIRVAKHSKPEAVAPFVAVLALATGARSKELKQLKLGSIYLDAPNPYFYVRRETTKTDSGARYVAVGKVASWALRQLIGRANKLGAMEPDHYLLPTLLDRHTRKSDPLNGRAGYDPTVPQSSWDAEWDVVRKQAGIEKRRFHDLRHTYITRAAEAGVPLEVTRAQVGHLSIQMTQHYTHICTSAIHEAARKIELKQVDLLRELNPEKYTAKKHARTTVCKRSSRTENKNTNNQEWSNNNDVR